MAHLPQPILSRFIADLERLLGREKSPKDRFGIAVSGGPDSMALLALTQAAFPGQVEAATVDHGFRPEAADEAAIVAQWCQEQGVSHATLRPHVPITGNLQSAARAERYRLLWQWCDERKLNWLLTAHHADDQLETILMRLNRGSGVSGLAGIRGRSDRLLRPLLFWTRAELAHVVAQAGCSSVQDPSNRDVRYDRAALRLHLSETDWLDSISASRSAAALNEAEIALEWVVNTLEQQYIDYNGEEIRLSRIDFPREIQRRLLLRMLARLDPGLTPRGNAIDQALVQLALGKKYTIGMLLLSGGGNWIVKPAPPRRRPG
ncbi:tRNA lysidine(34) synthetase TilS [Rhizorhapis suberifaciens]|uniref:tRNA(Ile)-lysidine synthase n=1 Tax=Rhizorhapis suberifaciens TaxID=13656 RepID=A0A840HUJ4_9SPHN|nr:tRNA lysidine(34) synthetase TilS [Rhizorhapis suberifaciens]MBB4641361.1 tRNA(Ile)-lysidine synthase [Rhizorhapis suberifaciens]